MSAAAQRASTEVLLPGRRAAEADCCVWCGLPARAVRSDRSGVDEAERRPEDAAVYCCYGCRVAHAITQESGTEGAVRWTVVRLGLSIFFTMNLMAFTMTMWSLDVYEVQQSPFQQKLFELFRWISMLFSLPVLLLLGVPLLQNAVLSWRQRNYSADLLIVTGVVAAYVTSVLNVIRGGSHVYFEVGAMVLVAVTFGRWLEAAGRQKATEALDKLAALLPEKVCRLTEDGEQSVDSTQITAGDLLRFRAGERFATDAVLVTGRTTVDEQVFTGESTPIERTPGAPLLAGTVNLDGDVIVRATSGFREGSFGRLLRLLQEARMARGKYQQLADRIADWFFPAVSVIALLTLVLHADQGISIALQHGLSVLLIACPCALGLATPLAVWTSLSTAVQHHVLFRSGEAIERLADVSAVCFDKTGTLTTGTPVVTGCQVCSSAVDETERISAASVCELAAASVHPFSTAVVDYCRAEGSSRAFQSIRTVPGAGVEGIRTDGSRLRLGSPAFVLNDPDFEEAEGWQEKIAGSTPPQKASSPAFVRALRMDADRSGRSLVVAGPPGDVQLAFIISESLRAEANPALLELSRLGINLNVLTGDRHERAQRLQQELSAEATVRVFGQLKPEEKVRVLNRIRRESGCTAMVGDGINDAPALAAADIGIALGCGTDISRDSAQVCLLSNDLRRIPWAISLARRTRTVIRQNLFWAFGYNSVGVVVAAAGWLNPAVAAGLMIASSLLVITNSMRLLGNARPDTEPATGSAPVSVAGLQSDQDHHIAIQEAAASTAFRTATVNTDRTDRMVAERTEASGCGVAS